MKLTGEELSKGLSLYMTHLGLCCSPCVMSNSKGAYNIQLYFEELTKKDVDKIKSLGLYLSHSKNWVTLDSEKFFSMISKTFICDGTGVQFFLIEEEPENTYVFLSESGSSINVKAKSYLKAYTKMLAKQKEE